MKNVLLKNCLECDKVFYKKQTTSKAEWFGSTRRPNGVQFCNRKCAVTYQHRTPVSEETRKKLSDAGKEAYKEGRQTGFEKGQIPWNKNTKGVMPYGDAIPNWKGEDASYASKHDWVYRHYGKPTQCEYCGDTSKQRRIQWSNKDHKYRRIITDWQQLCCSCHTKYDYKMRSAAVA